MADLEQAGARPAGQEHTDTMRSILGVALCAIAAGIVAAALLGPVGGGERRLAGETASFHIAAPELGYLLKQSWVSVDADGARHEVIALGRTLAGEEDFTAIVSFAGTDRGVRQLTRIAERTAAWFGVGKHPNGRHRFGRIGDLPVRASGDAFAAPSVFGPIQIVPLRLSLVGAVKSCLGFASDPIFGLTIADMSVEQISGWYCGRPGTPVHKDQLIRAIDSIGPRSDPTADRRAESHLDTAG